MFNRRKFLILSTVGFGTTVIGYKISKISRSVAAPVPTISPPLAKFIDQLPIPSVVDLTGGGSHSLTMTPGKHQFHTNLPVTVTQNTTWGYGTTYLGPTIQVQAGNPVNITFTNAVGSHPLANSIDTNLHGTLTTDINTPRVSLHLHGGFTAPEFDGNPEDTFLPTQSKTYTYKNNQEAATTWYHDHAIGITRLNVYAGLAGLYLIRDQFDTGLPNNPLGLPTGEYELPLVIQDKSFNADGSLFYPPAPWVPEFFGDVAVVNGKAWPNLNVKKGLYRFRMVNGSNARFYNLRLSNGQPFIQIGTDGGLLNAPVALGNLLLAPGERADVLIDFSGLATGTQIVLTNNAVTPYPTGPRNRRKGGLPIKEIMRFTVGNTIGFTGLIPTTLRGGINQPALLPALPAVNNVRNLTLVEILDPVTGAPLKVLLNNLPYHTNSIETPQQGAVEQWNIINTTLDTHPIHLHLVQFRLLARQTFDFAAYLLQYNPALPNPSAEGLGPWPAPSADAFAKGAAKRPERNENGWKDTVQANPGEITRISVRFPTQSEAGFNPDAAYVSVNGQTIRGYVWHCHLLEHEDHDMMLPYRVI